MCRLVNLVVLQFLHFERRDPRGVVMREPLAQPAGPFIEFQLLDGVWVEACGILKQPVGRPGVAWVQLWVVGIVPPFIPRWITEDLGVDRRLPEMGNAREYMGSLVLWDGRCWNGRGLFARPSMRRGVRLARLLRDPSSCVPKGALECL